MPKPPTSVRSIRLPEWFWAIVAKHAAEAGLSVNAYVARRLSSDLTGPRPAAEPPMPAKPKVAVKAAAPLRFTRAAPGSRLKGAK
jgi:hypothetical protein